MNTNTLQPSASKVQAPLTEFADKLNFILEDFVCDQAMITEVNGEYTKLRLKIENLIAVHQKEMKDIKEELDERDETIDTLKKELKALDGVANQVSDLNEQIEELESKLKEDPDFVQAAYEKGYSFIRIRNMEQRAKLEAFIEKEIYPHYNDQKEFLII